MNTIRQFLRLMGTDRWRPRHYAAALYLCLSLLALTGMEFMPWWGMLLTMANLIVAARCALGIPIPEEEEEEKELSSKKK